MAQREQHNRKLYKTQDKTEILSVLVSKIGTLYRIYQQIRDEQNTERVTKEKRVNKAKPLDVLKKAAQKPVPAQKAEPEKGNIVGCQADRLNDFAARSPDC